MLNTHSGSIYVGSILMEGIEAARTAPQDPDRSRCGFHRNNPPSGWNLSMQVLDVNLRSYGSRSALSMSASWAFSFEVEKYSIEVL